MLLMEGTAATETMMNRLHHRPMRGGVSRVGERFVSSAQGLHRPSSGRTRMRYPFLRRQIVCRAITMLSEHLRSPRGMLRRHALDVSGRRKEAAEEAIGIE